MDRGLTVIGALSAAFAVGAGAFAAHALEDRITPERLDVFEVAARYQMYHSLALLFCAWGGTRFAPGAVRWAARLFVVGIVLFSGSLYALVLSDIPELGAITPLGGLAFLSGWVALAWAARRPREIRDP